MNEFYDDWNLRSWRYLKAFDFLYIEFAVLNNISEDFETFHRINKSRNY